MDSEYRGYLLMHRDVPVAHLTLDGATGSIVTVGELLNTAHLPVGVPVCRGKIDRTALNLWWSSRAIPSSRARLRPLMEELPAVTPQQLPE